MTQSKSFYLNGKIKAENKLEYLHEKYHKHIAEETNFNLIQSIAFFIMILCLAFYDFKWKLASIILFFGLEVLEEILGWAYAYRHIKDK